LPLTLTFNQENGKAYLAEGNHRLAVAMSEGIPYLPVHVTSKWLEPNDSGNFKIMANHLEISKITEELLPQHFGLPHLILHLESIILQNREPVLETEN
jgi:hypothetical protein